MKLCSRCKLWKTRDQYTQDRNTLDGVCTYCKECRKIIRKEDYERNKKRNAARSRRKRYGITASQFALIKGRQGEACAICLNPFLDKKDTHLDHCHKTGQIRGILCAKCNTSIGRFNDDPEILSRAATYLKRPRGAPKEHRLFDDDGAA